MNSNRSIAEQCLDAIEEAATKRVIAMAARKLAERSYDAILLRTEGKNKEEREARARSHPAYIELDDKASLAEQDAIVAKAKADGLQVVFEEFRTRAATARAEMNLR